MDLRFILRRLNSASLCGVIVYLISGTLLVSAIDVYTPEEVFFENGTTATLKCSFKSKEVVSSSASVTWSFMPDGSDKSISFFYYSGLTMYPVQYEKFEKRINWVGDLNKKDASIQVLQMQFSDNGTYLCDVKNPPDFTGVPARTKVRVVMKESLPQTSPAIIAVGVIAAVICLIVIAVVTYLIMRRQEPRHEYDGCHSNDTTSSQTLPPGKKAESSMESSRCSSPSAPVQGPVIYAQLDHSGNKSASIHKMEPVVYADIRKN
ncbi:myelin protein zero-like 1 like [Engraulis encrasicolus]|uniref:myelin protein zero-like 1 like n=1 Tax=Engraulis encrasicolus TaxID=184585 RepID=UPI002FD65E2E